MLGYEALTGSLEDFGFEDYLNSKTVCHLLSISHYPVLSHLRASIFSIVYDHLSILSQRVLPYINI